MDSLFYVAAEYLGCKSCNAVFMAYRPELMSQLDLGQSLQFPVILTHRTGLDTNVVTLLRYRTLGNSSMAIHHIIEEMHSQRWLNTVLLQLSNCDQYQKETQEGIRKFLVYQENTAERAYHPHRSKVWLITATLTLGHRTDVANHLEEMKAQVASTYESVKKITGKCAGTATWVTNVGNERGEILLSVLTSEWFGLNPMAQRLVSRYDSAKEPPPDLMYVDRDSCTSD